MKKNIFYILIVILSLSCAPRKSNKKIYEENFKKNVSSCASVFIKQNKVDSLSAIAYCSCMLTQLYQLDSTFVSLKNKDLTEMINKNRDKISIACDSLLLKPKTN